MSLEARTSSKPRKFCSEHKHPPSDEIKTVYKLIGKEAKVIEY